MGAGTCTLPRARRFTRSNLWSRQLERLVSVRTAILSDGRCCLQPMPRSRGRQSGLSSMAGGVRRPDHRVVSASLSIVKEQTGCGGGDRTHMFRVNNPAPCLVSHPTLAAVTGLEPATAGSTIQRLVSSASRPQIGGATGSRPRNWTLRASCDPGFTIAPSRPRRDSNPDQDLRRVPRFVAPRGRNRGTGRIRTGVSGFADRSLAPRVPCRGRAGRSRTHSRGFGDRWFPVNRPPCVLQASESQGLEPWTASPRQPFSGRHPRPAGHSP